VSSSGYLRTAFKVYKVAVHIWDPKGLQQQILDWCCTCVQAYNIAKNLQLIKPDKINIQYYFDAYNCIYEYTILSWRVKLYIWIYNIILTRTIVYMNIQYYLDAYNCIYEYKILSWRAQLYIWIYNIILTRTIVYMNIQYYLDAYNCIYGYTILSWHVKLHI